MGRNSIPAVLSLMLLLASGCASSSRMNPLAWGSKPASAEKKDDTKIAESNPFYRTGKGAASKTDAPKTEVARAEPARKAETAKKDPDVRQASATAPKAAAGTSHDAETLKLIESELRDATPEEREQLFADLKGLDPPLVRQILRMRRMVRQIGQTSADPAEVAAMPSHNHGALPSPDSVAGVRHVAEPQNPVRAPAAPTTVPFAGLGTANPWGNASPPVGPGAAIQPPAAPPFGTNGPYDARNPGGMMPPSAPQQPAGMPGQPQVALAAATGFPPTFGHSSHYVPSTPGVPAPAAPANPVIAPQGTYTQPWGHGLPIVGPSGSANAPPPGTPLQPGMPVVPPAGPAAAPVAQPVPGAPVDPQMSLQQSALVGQYTPRPTAYSPKWNEDLQKLISIAEAEIGQATLTPDSTDLEKRDYIEKHVDLRLLYLMSGQQERALQAIPGLSAAEQEFWQQMFWAVANYFDADAIPDSADRASQTITQLRGAVQRLQENAKLELRNVNFCHKIASYGNYERFQRDEFSQGQPVLVYAEVSNFKSDPTTDGQYRTVLKSTIEIFKAGPNGGLVERMSFPATEDLCRNPRRDYFHSYEFTIPTAQKITLGPHVLKLTVEDELSRKVATYTLNFTVK